jgi:tight adherence protein B
VSDQSLFVLMIFVIVLLMAQAFVNPIMGSSAQARRRLRGRIRELSLDAASQRHVSAIRSKYLKKLSPLGQRLEALPGMERLRVLIEQAGRDYFAYRVLLTGGGIGLAAAVVITSLFRGGAAEAGAAFLVGGVLPFLWLTKRRRQRMAKFEEQLPDALSVVARSLQAGLPFSEAMHMVAQEMDEPVGREFGTVFSELNLGGDVRSALLGMLERMPTVAVMAMVTSILIQRETGGNLAEVLDRISGLVRQRFRFQRSVRTFTAEGRMSAWVVSLIPFVLAAGLEALEPGSVTGLIADPGGRKLVIAAFVLMIAGILWIRRLIRIDI